MNYNSKIVTLEEDYLFNVISPRILLAFSSFLFHYPLLQPSHLASSRVPNLWYVSRSSSCRTLLVVWYCWILGRLPPYSPIPWILFIFANPNIRPLNPVMREDWGVVCIPNLLICSASSRDVVVTNVSGFLPIVLVVWKAPKVYINRTEYILAIPIISWHNSYNSWFVWGWPIPPPNVMMSLAYRYSQLSCWKSM